MNIRLISLVVVLIFSFLPQVAYASDFSGLFFFAYLAILVPPLIIATFIYAYHKKNEISLKVKFLMALPFVLVMAPVPNDSVQVYWPFVFELFPMDLSRLGKSTFILLIYLVITYGLYLLMKRSNDSIEQHRIKQQEEVRHGQEHAMHQKIREKTRDL